LSFATDLENTQQKEYSREISEERRAMLEFMFLNIARPNALEASTSEKLAKARFDLAMLAITLLLSTVTLGTGRTHMMQGGVHLVVFAAFLLLAFVP
jgi:Ca2+/H+ antiporter